MPLPVRVQDVVDAFEEMAEFTLHFLDKRTGEIVALTDEEWEAAEADELISSYPEWQREMILQAREIQKSDDFVELPNRIEIDEYKMMERFAGEYEDSRTSAELLRSIKGKGSSRRFKDTILDLGIQQKWYDFRSKELEELAVEWLEDEGIPYTREEITEPRPESTM